MRKEEIEMELAKHTDTILLYFQTEDHGETAGTAATAADGFRPILSTSTMPNGLRKSSQAPARRTMSAVIWVSAMSGST